ncbi:MAG TPA: hypothetical protein VKV28_11265 [Candidatus Binataceae bacterium]|nr:hypothetical protein [Candidatus Binataceae bacterium]
MRVLGIYREARFSPGKVEVDAAILDAALAHLAHQGCAVTTIDGAELESSSHTPAGANLILAMCQSRAALSGLELAQRAGTIVINQAAAIRACYRDRMGPILHAAGIPTPPGRLVKTDLSPTQAAAAVADFSLASGLFVKRGDLHALAADDVTRIETLPALLMAMHQLAKRGAKKAYLQAAVEGKVVKFYGVSRSFFEVVNGPEELRSNMVNALAQAAQKAAAMLGLEVWGGDAVVDEHRFYLIDFNDWPSFAAVRERAAVAIANHAMSRIDSLRRR